MEKKKNSSKRQSTSIKKVDQQKPSAENRNELNKKIGMARLRSNKETVRQFHELKSRWKSLQEERKGKNPELLKIQLEELKIHHCLRTLEREYNLPFQYFDCFLEPHPPFITDTECPSYLIPPLLKLDIPRENQLREIARHLHKLHENEPSPSREIFSIWDKEPKPEDFLDDDCITRSIVRRKSRYRGQKHLILVLKIDAQENIDDVLLPQIKKIILYNRAGLIGFPRKKRNQKQAIQAQMYRDYMAGKSLETIESEYRKHFHKSGKQFSLSASLTNSRYNLNAGCKLVNRGEPLTKTQNDDLKSQAKKVSKVVPYEDGLDTGCSSHEQITEEVKNLFDRNGKLIVDRDTAEILLDFDDESVLKKKRRRTRK